MKIKIREVPLSGMAYTDQALAADLDIVDDFIDSRRPVVVSGTLTRIEDYIIANVTVSYYLAMVCARCLTDVHKAGTAVYDLELEFGPKDEYVDLGRAVRDELLISYDPHTLCGDDCKGLCTGCGADLNKEKCQCDVKPMKGSKGNAKSKKTTFQSPLTPAPDASKAHDHHSQHQG
ncbi:MAG: DUF177 domain-containing protein [Candidatus Omnitrophica bacterium]|nr:DUF177 domain-containing protein [Candidatus Omnitrophota bacterium]